MVELQVLPCHAFRPSEQAARHRGGDDRPRQGALEVGLRERLPVEEAEMEDVPEIRVDLPHIGSELIARRERRAYLVDIGIEGDGLGHGERLEAFATGLHGHAGVHPAVRGGLRTCGHIGHVECAAAVDLRGAVDDTGTQGDDNDHNHADGQGRAQQRDPRDDGILAEVIERLLKILSEHIKVVSSQ